MTAVALTIFAGLQVQTVAVAVRGVVPDKLLHYSGENGKFHCLDNLNELPFSAVNDDYCDCRDGSDEPGTGACSGAEAAVFHCLNEGSQPKLLYASRVGDSICDCCDGSDELELSARRPCPISCALEGAAKMREREERLETLRVGLERKEDILRSAASQREGWRAELDKLKAQLQSQEAELELARTAAATSSVEELRGEVAALKSELAKKEETIQKLQSQLAEIGQDGAGPGEAAQDKEKPVVSEYAKWMDGAGSTPGAVEPATEDLQPDADAAGPARELAATNSSTSAAEAVKAAEAALQKTKDGMQEMRKKLKTLDKEKQGYHSLIEKCLERKDSQYTYKLCFFKDAKQDSVSLGSWEGFKGPKEAQFSNGQMCPGGPARSIRVIFQCGADEEVLSISEPSRCAYEALVSGPGACDESDRQSLNLPPLQHPRDEL